MSAVNIKYNPDENVVSTETAIVNDLILDFKFEVEIGETQNFYLNRFKMVAQIFKDNALLHTIQFPSIGTKFRGTNQKILKTERFNCEANSSYQINVAVSSTQKTCNHTFSVET